jgi:hypothetical protein
VRSFTDARMSVAIVVLLLIAASPLRAAAPHQESRRPTPGTPDRAEIARALETVKADPNLATERTIKTLRWRQSTDPKPRRMPTWLEWIAELFRWFEQSARVLVWCAAVALAGMLVVYVLRVLRTGRLPRGEDAFVAPTHVRDLDIRPETLPDDIGAAARDLWERGEHRASLALLYRGMLSRLAHVHGVPIRDSTTEGDCLVLAANRLPRERWEYLSRLVRVWQGFGYGREDVQAATVYVLCDDFAAAIDRTSPPDAVASPGAS